MGSKLGWWRIGCTTLIGLSVLTMMAYRGRQSDLELYRTLTARREALQILHHVKGIQVELMANPWDIKVQAVNRILGYPSLGPSRKAPDQKRLAAHLEMALGEYCRSGRFAPPDFYPRCAIVIGRPEGFSYILFSQQQNAMLTSIPGWDSAYFTLPGPLARHIEADLHLPPLSPDTGPRPVMP